MTDIPGAGQYEAPERELHGAFAEAVAAVNAPSEHLGEFQAVIREAEAGIKAANEARGKAAEAIAKAKSGVIHRDQVAIINRQVIEAAQEAVEQHRSLGAKLAQALPNALTAKAFPLPKRGDAAVSDAKSDLKTWVRSQEPDALAMAMTDRFAQAIREDDMAMANVLLSDFARDLLAAEGDYPGGPDVRRRAAEGEYAQMRQAMIARATEDRDRLPDAQRSALDALDAVTAAQQASDAGHMLAHTLVENLRADATELPRLFEPVT